MRRALVPLLFVLAAVVVGVVAGVILLGRDDELRDPTAEELALTRARVSVTGTLEPRVHLFGEPVVATIEALFDPRYVRAGTVRMEPAFPPYEVVDEERIESSGGDVTRVRYRYTLSCTRIGCMTIGRIVLSAALLVVREFCRGGLCEAARRDVL